jgi:hypothetical protein
LKESLSEEVKKESGLLDERNLLEDTIWWVFTYLLIGIVIYKVYNGQIKT